MYYSDTRCINPIRAVNAMLVADVVLWAAVLALSAVQSVRVFRNSPLKSGHAKAAAAIHVLIVIAAVCRLLMDVLRLGPGLTVADHWAQRILFPLSAAHSWHRRSSICSSRPLWAAANHLRHDR